MVSIKYSLFLLLLLVNIVCAKPVIDLWNSPISSSPLLYDAGSFVCSIQEKNSNVVIVFDQDLKALSEIRKAGYETIIVCLTTSQAESPLLYKLLTSNIKKYDLVLTDDQTLLSKFPYKCKPLRRYGGEKNSLSFLPILENAWPFLRPLFMPSTDCDLRPFLKPIQHVQIPSGIAGIDCIYVVNLAERPEKWKASQRLAKEHHLTVNRFDAINGWKLSSNPAAKEVTQFGTAYQKAPKCYLSWGGVGCYLSHLSILKDAYERGFNKIWIWEDDITFHASSSQIETILVKLDAIDPDWDIFYTDPNNRDATGRFRVGSHPIIPPIQLENKGQAYYNQIDRIDETLSRIRVRGGTYSMIFSKKGIKKMYEALHKIPILTPYDDTLHFVKDLREYAATAPLVTHVYSPQGGVPSDTWSPIKN
jgi:GR25 family glycosyltransferase involved in LPS biosynthesis